MSEENHSQASQGSSPSKVTKDTLDSPSNVASLATAQVHSHLPRKVIFYDMTTDITEGCFSTTDITEGCFCRQPLPDTYQDSKLQEGKHVLSINYIVHTVGHS